jgi:methyl-accepting chemotaxis protein
MGKFKQKSKKSEGKSPKKSEKVKKKKIIYNRLSINSIRFKILVMVISFLLIAVLFIGTFIAYRTNDLLSTQNYENLNVLNQSGNKIVNSNISTNMQYLKNYSMGDLYEYMIYIDKTDNANDVILETSNLKSKLLINLAANRYIDTYKVLDRESNYIVNSNDKDNLNQEIYDLILEGGVKDYITTDMYYYNSAPKIDIYFPIRHYSNTYAWGVLLVTIDISNLVENIDSIKFGTNESSSTYIVDEQGTILYNIDETLVTQVIDTAFVDELAALYVEAETEEDVVLVTEDDSEIVEDDFIQTILEYDLNGVTHIGSFSAIDNEFGWYVVTTVGKSDLASTIREILVSVILIAVITLILGFFIVLFVSKRITNAILKSEKLINKTSRLDLVDNTEYEILLKNTDETGKIARAIFNMIDVLKNVVKKIMESTRDILNNSKELQTISEDVESKLMITNSVAQQLSAGMEEMTSAAQEINCSVENVNQSLIEISDHVSNAVELSQNINEKAINIKENSINAKEHLNIIYKEVKQNIQNSMQYSKDSIGKIADFSNVIKNIAEQTNLLSLNASIEAARAGEYGKGFAVVAQEIRSLAVESSNAVNDINKGVQQISVSIEEFSNNSIRLLGFVEKDVINDYEDMVANSNSYSQDASNINNILNELGIRLTEFKSIMNDIEISISETSKTTSLSAEEISDIAMQSNDILKMITNINSIIVNNNTNVEELNLLVNKFKVK